MFAFIRNDFNVTYTELALALTVFNVVSGVLQTPVGFLVDRIGARVVLIVGLALSSIAYAVAGIVDSYWVFIAMYGVAGIGNTVFHPSDYSLLSHHAKPERLSQVFSFHTFAGMVGSAIAPITLLYMQSLFGWRGAYLGAASFGLLVVLVLILQSEPPPELHAPKPNAKKKTEPVDTGWRLLMSPPILLNFGFFVLTSIMNGGLNTYLVVALGALHGTPAAVGNMALTGLLAMNAVGVLAGGAMSGRTSQHAAIVAASGLTVGGIVTAIVGLFDLPYGIADPADGLQRILRRRDLSLARHAGAFGDAAQRLRQGVWLRQHRLQCRRQHRADRLWHADGSRRAARSVSAVGGGLRDLRLDRDVRLFAPGNTLTRILKPAPFAVTWANC